MTLPIRNIFAELHSRVIDDVWHITGSGAPVDGTTGKGLCGKSSTYADIVNGELYLNTGDRDLPTWEPFSRNISTGDPWLYDFSSEDFWSNVGGPGTGSWDIIDAELKHPGIQRAKTGVASGDVTSFFVPVTANAGFLRFDQIRFARFVFRTPPTLTLSRFEVGLSSDPRGNWPTADFELGTDMIYLFRDTNVGTHLRLKVKAGGSVTTNIVIVDPCPASTWIDVNFKRRLVGAAYVVDAFVNGVLITTISTGLPVESVAFGGVFRIGTRTTAARELDVDLVDIRPTSILGPRFDAAL